MITLAVNEYYYFFVSGGRLVHYPHELRGGNEFPSGCFLFFKIFFGVYDYLFRRRNQSRSAVGRRRKFTGLLFVKSFRSNKLVSENKTGFYFIAYYLG